MMRLLFVLVLMLLPMQSFATQIAVPVVLEYQGNRVQALMAVDTGAEVTTIGSVLASRLGVPADTGGGGVAELADGRKAYFRSVKMNVSAGDMDRNGLRVNIMEYASDRAVDGWLGMDFLSTMTLTIDWRNHRLYWSRP